MRDFVWVQDCVNVMIWLLDNPEVSGLFNVGSGQARPFKDVAQNVFHTLGQSPRIDYVDMPEVLQEKYQYFTQADLSRLRAAGYKAPMTSLEEGIEQYVQNYLTKKDPYR
jgi:ADP-L-glycero-D-manno-heptose 6-epimerase